MIIIARLILLIFMVIMMKMRLSFMLHQGGLQEVSPEQSLDSMGFFIILFLIHSGVIQIVTIMIPIVIMKLNIFPQSGREFFIPLIQM